MPAYGANPYARPPDSVGGAAPNPSGKYRLGGPGRYAVPDVPETTDPEWTDGFSPHLAAGGSYDGTRFPDIIRIGKRKPPPNDPNDKHYTAVRDAEKARRLTVEHVTEPQPRIRQSGPYVPPIPDQVQPKLPTRRTATMAPSDAILTRPWHVPRNATDALGPNAVLHFSMADHRRNYPIMMMQPRGGIGINNIRNQPVPWDTELYVQHEPAPPNTPGLFGSRRFGL